MFFEALILAWRLPSQTLEIQFGEQGPHRSDVSRYGQHSTTRTAPLSRVRVSAETTSVGDLGLLRCCTCYLGSSSQTRVAYLDRTAGPAVLVFIL